MTKTSLTIDSESNEEDWTVEDLAHLTTLAVKTPTGRLSELLAALSSSQQQQQQQHQLQHLTLSSCRLASAQLKTLPLQNLQTLDLSNNDLGPRGAKFLTLSPQLTTLNLTNCRLGHLGGQALGRLLLESNCTNLRVLILAQNSFTADGIWKLAPSFGPLASLKELDLSDNGMADDGCLEIANRLLELKSLEKLNLSRNGIQQIGMQGLGEKLMIVASHSSLVELDLSCNTGALLQLGPTLRTLKLASNRIDNAQASAMAQVLKTMAATLSLQYLDLSDNAISDSGAGDLVEAIDDVPSLAVLKLDQNEISPARMRILDMLLRHRVLSSPMATRSQPTSTSTDAASTMLDASERSASKAGGGAGAMDYSYDESAIESAREYVLERIDSDDPTHHQQQHALQLEADYVLKVTNNLESDSILQHGAFGKLYAVHDDNVEQELVLRVVELLPAVGPMQNLRDNVIKEIAAARNDEYFLPVLGYTSLANGIGFLYKTQGKQTLQTLLTEAREQLDWKTRARLLHGVASALAFLHKTKTVHGDLNPSNIYIYHDDDKDEYRVQLLDFGLSRLMATDRQRFASGDVVYGSRGYRCFRYERGYNYTPASDMFSFGIVLGEVLTGTLQRTPTNTGPFDICFDCVLSKNNTLQSDPKAGSVPKQLLEGMVQILLSCLSPNIMQRPSASTAAEILGQLSS